MTSIEYVHMLFDEDASKYEREQGYWLTASVETAMSWTTEKTVVFFRGRRVLLLPGSEKTSPAVAILNPNSSTMEDEDRTLIHHFLSSLAWAEQRAIRVIGWLGGGRPFRYSIQGTLQTVARSFRIPYLPDSIDEETRLALALYREGLGLEHIAYSFLSFYKVINLKHPSGKKAQKAWILKNLGMLDDDEAIARADQIAKSEGDVADYLYDSCRCAIAHAGLSPTVNPEDMNDEVRLRNDLPLIQNLAQILIEREFGIQSVKTYLSQHLYCLAGFKCILGEDQVRKLMRGKAKYDSIKITEEFSIRLFRDGDYSPLEKMTAIPTVFKGGVLTLELNSLSGCVAVTLGLDFGKDLLLFNPENGITIKDDNSSSVCDEIAEVYRFLQDYYKNGILEVWLPYQEKCIAWCSPYIPRNINLRGTLRNFEMERLKWVEGGDKRKIEEK